MPGAANHLEARPFALSFVRLVKRSFTRPFNRLFNCPFKRRLERNFKCHAERYLARSFQHPLRRPFKTRNPDRDLPFSIDKGESRRDTTAGSSPWEFLDEAPPNRPSLAFC